MSNGGEEGVLSGDDLGVGDNTGKKFGARGWGVGRFPMRRTWRKK